MPGLRVSGSSACVPALLGSAPVRPCGKPDAPPASEEVLQPARLWTVAPPQRAPNPPPPEVPHLGQLSSSRRFQVAGCSPARNGAEGFAGFEGSAKAADVRTAPRISLGNNPPKRGYLPCAAAAAADAGRCHLPGSRILPGSGERAFPLPGFGSWQKPLALLGSAAEVPHRNHSVREGVRIGTLDPIRLSRPEIRYPGAAQNWPRRPGQCRKAIRSGTEESARRSST